MRMRPRLALCHNATDDIEPVLSAAAGCAAVSGLEITLDPADGTRLPALTSRVREAGLATRFHYPLCRHQIATEDPVEGASAEAEIARALGIIGGIGDSHLTLHAPLHSGTRDDDVFALTIERLHRLVEEGRRHGVRVCLENLRWGETSDPVAFLHLIESTGAGATIDIGHAASSEAARLGFGADRFVKLLSPRVETAHVYAYEDHDGHHAPAELRPLERTLDALCETACEWWTVELHDLPTAVSTSKLLRDYLDVRYDQQVESACRV